MIALLNNADMIIQYIDHTINRVNEKNDHIVSIVIIASLFSENNI